jgi:hypothetical protein
LQTILSESQKKNKISIIRVPIIMCIYEYIWSSVGAPSWSVGVWVNWIQRECVYTYFFLGACKAGTNRPLKKKINRKKGTEIKNKKKEIKRAML